MSDEIKIKTGDVVRLKSGGPPMTAGEMTAGGIYQDRVECLWFESSILMRGGFPVDALEPCTVSGGSGRF